MSWQADSTHAVRRGCCEIVLHTDFRITASEARMAEINIQRRERSIWPWLLAGVLLLGLLWFLFARNTDTLTAGRADTTAADTSGAAAGTIAPPATTPPPTTPPPR
jgi:hypothetical protein